MGSQNSQGRRRNEHSVRWSLRWTCVSDLETLDVSDANTNERGWATSKVLRAALVPYVSNALSSVTPTSSNELVDDAIKKAFVRLDDRIFRNAQEALESGQDQGSAAVIIAVAPAIAGSCALLTMYEPKTSTLRTA